MRCSQDYFSVSTGFIHQIVSISVCVCVYACLCTCILHVHTHASPQTLSWPERMPEEFSHITYHNTLGQYHMRQHIRQLLDINHAQTPSRTLYTTCFNSEPTQSANNMHQFNTFHMFPYYHNRAARMSIGCT